MISIRAKIIGTIVVLIITAPLTLKLLGYHVNAISGDVAPIAAKYHDVNICQKIIYISPTFGGPTAGDQRRYCIFAYAKLAEDPAACELLMPSDYGLYCVGEAMATEDGINNRPYFCNADKDKERCYSNKSSTPIEFEYAACESIAKDKQYERDWCYIGPYI